MTRTTGSNIVGPTPAKHRGTFTAEIVEYKRYDGNSQRNLGYRAGGKVRIEQGGRWRKTSFQSKVEAKKGALVLVKDMGDFVEVLEVVGQKYY